MEGTAPVAVPTAQAVPGPVVQGQVMLPGQGVALQRQIVVFVDEGNVQPGGAGVAVLAVNAPGQSR